MIAVCLLLLLFSSLLVSCNEDKIEVYRIPKQVVAAQEMPPRPAAAPARWSAPPDWNVQPASEMRIASFKVNGADSASADVSVTAFPGDAGGLVSNVNRWRGQLELPPLTEEQLTPTMVQIEVQGEPVYLVDLQTLEKASKPARILGAVLERPDRTWFVKMSGPPPLLESQKQTFLDFVKSFQFENTEQPSSARQKSTNDE